MEGSLYERRVLGEWQLLLALAERNPERIADPELQDDSIGLRLVSTPAFQLDGSMLSEHRVSIGFPVHYPAAPMTLHLGSPVKHPNVHPRSGFVCLWADHRVSNTVEHALHKTVAILGGRLFNADPIHVMQPESLPWLQSMRDAGETSSLYAPLHGIESEHQKVIEPALGRRRRLS